MDFIAIDFETATSSRSSPCALGMTFVRNNVITETRTFLIKPYTFPRFDAINVHIHGITPEMVEDKPEFHELWDEIKSLIENNLLVAHNASFDFSVLRWTMEQYQIPFPSFNYVCTYIISKNAWPGLPTYNLGSLCKKHSLDFIHHDAGEDSRVCAELMLKAMSTAGIIEDNELENKLQISVGRIFDKGYLPCENKRKGSQVKSTVVERDLSKVNIESIFFGKTVVFTGTLLSMPRISAQQIILDIGGSIGKSVTKETDFLVVGYQDFRIVGEDGMSSKQEKAIKMIETGWPLEILSEADFLKNI